LLAATEQRTALVIGNSAYSSGPLKNPVNDATSIAAQLQKLGFTVILKKNANLRGMEDALTNFGDRLKRGGVGLFFYAGHGLQVGGANYLVPIGARINGESDIKYEALDAGKVLDEMGNANNGLNIVILDACRDNPYTRSFRNAARGLAIVSSAPAGTFVSYSTSPGNVARDGDGRNSPYTEALLKYMKEPGLSIEHMFKKVRTSLSKNTVGKQIPWELSSLQGDFYFVPSATAVATTLEQIDTSPKKKANQVIVSDTMDTKGTKIATVRPPGMTEKKYTNDNCGRMMEKGDQYAEKAMWGNALIQYQKAEALKCGHPELFGKLLDAKDNIVKRVRKSIAIFDFGSPSNERDAGKIAANKLIAYLHRNASYDLRIIERENLQSILREVQLDQTGVVDIKSAQTVGKMRGIDAFIVGDILNFSAKTTDIPSTSQVKVLVSEEGERKNYQFIPYKHGTAKISAMIEIAYKLIDTQTGENIYSTTIAGKLIKEDKYSDGVPAGNVPHDPMQLPTEAEVLDELANAKVSEMGQSILKRFQSLEVEYFNQARQFQKRQNFDQAIERYTDAIFDEKLKGIATPISKQSSEMIDKLTLEQIGAAPENKVKNGKNVTDTSDGTAIALAVPSTMSSQRSTKPKVSVFHFGSVNIDASGYGAAVTNRLNNALSADPVLSLLDQRELMSFLSLNDLQQNEQMNNVINIGTRLGLDAIVVGSVEKRGTVIIINCKVVHIKQRRAILNVQVSSLGESGLINEISKLSSSISRTILESGLVAQNNG
jgi:curli biogenesis system outer membrane secretion channel CsgG/TolB-like protein